MYCVIQEIENKKCDLYGEYKELEVYESTWTIADETTTTYCYRYTGERFERPIKKAYKISIHKSYRENGKVKKKQWVICTIGYYYIATYGGYIGDCCNLEKKAESIGITVDELYDIVESKYDSLRNIIDKEYQATEEYKVHQEHRAIIDKYLKKKSEFEEVYGANTYDYCYDVFGELRNKEKLEDIKRQYEASKNYQRSYYENFESNYSNYDFSGYFKTNSSTYTEEEKQYLKKIYKAAAMKLHPDTTKDNGEGMKFLNKLKEQWDI